MIIADYTEHELEYFRRSCNEALSFRECLYFYAYIGLHTH